MVKTLWLALAVMLVIEGLMPLIAPATWRETFRRVMELKDGQIRFFGLAAIVLGLGLFWLLS